MAGDILRYRWKPARAYTPGRIGNAITSIILHSTDGHEAGDIATLTGPKVSVHWYVTKRGALWHFVDNGDTAYHAGRVREPRYSNRCSVGIEQEHIDGEEVWLGAQVETVARLVAFLRQQYGGLPVKSHAEVAAPKGRKVDPMDYPWDRLHVLVQEAMQTTWTMERI